MKRILSCMAAVQLLAACSTEKPMDYDVTITPYHGGSDCAISFTYDDGMLCHYTDIAPELEKRGFRGTFWIIGANMDKDEPEYPWMSWEQVADLSRRDHEISNHTWNHPALPSLSAAEVEEELKKCDDKIEEVTGKRPISMAYPYNAMSPDVVTICEKGRVGTRTFQTGHGQIASHTTIDSMRVWLNELIENGTWGVTMTHGTTYGWDMWNTPDELYQFYDDVKSKGTQVWVAPFAEVAAYLKEREAATLEVNGTTRRIRLTVHHSLDASLFAEPLTLSVKGGDWSGKTPTATQQGVALDVVNQGNELLVTLSPGDEVTEISW